MKSTIAQMGGRARAGIGLRPPHYREVLAQRPDIGFLEVHSENFFGAGGQPLRVLQQARDAYPISLHGVGLSLGSDHAMFAGHLRQLAGLVERVDPFLVSDHLSWSAFGNRHLNDLFPLPYTEEALSVVCRQVERAQDALGRRILVENVSSYLEFADSTIPEWEFVAAVARRTGCGVLLDVNNIYVSSVNHGFDASAYLQSIPRSCVEEIHLAGFERASLRGGSILIDTHGSRVAGPVWNLYGEALTRFGPVPTLIEWDTDVPELSILLEEAHQAQAILDEWRSPEDAHALAA